MVLDLVTSSFCNGIFSIVTRIAFDVDIRTLVLFVKVRFCHLKASLKPITIIFCDFLWVITHRVLSTREGNVFSRICLSTARGGGSLSNDTLDPFPSRDAAGKPHPLGRTSPEEGSTLSTPQYPASGLGIGLWLVLPLNGNGRLSCFHPHPKDGGRYCFQFVSSYLDWGGGYPSG